ncbi:hypothetical protein [Pedobacter heparinus]|uniref:hypothetical protein n=1 Tax=Pedobacter heparinus TaxID=984 RepID=UPI002931BE34|nr:hypothetical protein [Pedobacter heparinus]
MKTIKLIPYDEDPVLDTNTLMAALGITKKEANDILWDLFEKEYIDLIPVLDEEKLNLLKPRD